MNSLHELLSTGKIPAISTISSSSSLFIFVARSTKQRRDQGTDESRMRGMRGPARNHQPTQVIPLKQSLKSSPWKPELSNPRQATRGREGDQYQRTKWFADRHWKQFSGLTRDDYWRCRRPTRYNRTRDVEALRTDSRLGGFPVPMALS